MLIEVMVGALLLGMATTAILNGLDGAQAVEKKNKIRSVQSTLAQQDIERMRSMPVTSLTNLNQTRTVQVAGVNYTVLSTTTWISDASGQVSCSDPNAGAEYLKLSSKVTSPGSKNNVTETALLSPGLGQLNASLGLATVKLVDRNGAPIASKTVNLSGASSQTKTTNSLGCAVFGYIPAGSYTATVPGYVEMASNGTANDPLVVYKGRASFGQMQVDVPASLKATFVPPSGNTLFTPATNVTSDDITVLNANLVPSAKVFTGTAANTLTASSCVGPPASSACGLFPFVDGVAVYAGSCPANNPASYAGQSNYFSTSGRGFTNLTPGQVGAPVNVEMPTLRIPVQRTGGTAFKPHLTVVPVSTDGCGSTPVWNETKTTSAATSNFDIAVPYGTYRLCADDSTAFTKRYTVVASVDLTAAPAVANKQQATMTVPTSGSTNIGQCPQ
jgi:type II secretory pathway pseudopilin PulG